jgi:septal ring factor EnvC (AmiA/AmiB activator)
MRSWLRPICLFLGPAVLPGPTLAIAQEKDPIAPLEEQIDLSRRRLTQIRDEKQRLRAEMDALSTQIHDVRAELDNLNLQAQNQEALLREMDNQLAIRDQQVRATTSDLLRTEDELVEKKVLFSRRARDLYKRGPLANVHILLSADSFSDLINRYQYLYLVALHDRLLVRQIEELRGLLEEQYSKLRRELQDMQQLRAEKVQEIQNLYHLEDERGRRLQAVRGLKNTAQRRLAQLDRDERELNGLLERLEREREAAEALAAAAPTRGTLTPAVRGTLDWPVDGRVMYSFGQQRNPDGTVILRNGVGIAAREGTPVKAVRPGTVVFAQPYVSYGPSVIISHGGGYYSLYLYLSEINVAEGDAVSAAQVIGRVGGSSTPEGAHLEFQIRERGRAIDPGPWLRSARG